MNYPDTVKIVEVSPRDGLQNEKQIIEVKDKLKLINGLREAGVKHIEVAGFVSPKWVPQLADASAVCAGLVHDGVTFCDIGYLLSCCRKMSQRSEVP